MPIVDERPRKPVPVDMNVVLLDLGGGAFQEVPVGQFERRRGQFSVGTVAWCHVGEDAHGRWTYRRVNTSG